MKRMHLLLWEHLRRPIIINYSQQMLLEYEKQIFTDLLEHDGLLIMARGLGIYRIITAMMKAFCHPASLVLIINASGYEEEHLIERMVEEGVEQMPQIISSEISRDERIGVYYKGGVLFVSTRILVMDLLTDKIPAHLVTGIMICNAHRVKEAGLEAFIMRLFRQRNKEGFIKAFSDHPVTFIDGYCQVEKVMKSLYLKKLFLYPRFQVSVKDSLERSEPEVIELGVPSSSAMKGCQMAVLDLIQLCIKEVKLCNPTLDLENVTYENLISTAFDATVRIQLDPIWHQLTNKTKQLVSDLKTLRELLRSLTHYDCVTFFSMVRSIKASEKQFQNNAGWLYTDAADKLYLCAKERLYGKIEEQAKNLSKPDEERSKLAKPVSLEFVTSGRSGHESCVTALLAEKNPKWEVLTEILTEINNTEEVLKMGDDSPAGRVLIAVDSAMTCNQIQDYLIHGPEKVMRQLLSKLEEPSAPKEKEVEKKKPTKDTTKLIKKRKTNQDQNQVTLTQLARGDTASSSTKQEAEPDKDDTEKDEANSKIKVIDATNRLALFSNQTTALLALRTSGDPNSLIRTLEAYQPRYVIMYDLEISYIRQLEIYKACRPGVQFRVYIMMFSGSSEEQRFLTAIRKEKDAFEQLIRQKAGMVVPENQDGRTPDEAKNTSTAANQTVISSRKGGVQTAAPQQSKVIVDMREFRSDLPFLVHKLGIDLEPVTLEVGDYILTQDICVERKSISDLIGSLNNGRLYNQCIAMSRFYKRPVLLIEFDPTKAFTLQKNFTLQQEISINDVQSRLALLTIHFPKLRILWCQSSHATADLFRDLKKGVAEPEVEKARTVTSEDTTNRDTKYNIAPYDTLMKLPFISTKNVKQVADTVSNIQDFASLSPDRLGEILGNKQYAQSIATFLTTEYTPETSSSTDKAPVATSSKHPARYRKPPTKPTRK